ncbi:MAG: threonine ammonia-lyase, biosynthetic [Alteromonadaceae bacterium]|nr:threonine ammonia-lyase, biosynthetic [Alteromonadaceae bacterium]
MTVSANEYLKKILLAPVYEAAVQSDCMQMTRLSETLQQQVFLKREDQQPVKSFKLRGAYNRIAQLSQAQLDAGVIAASAGNHAQGVAYAAKRKEIKATIVMPETTPDIKVEAVRNFGGEYVTIVQHGTSFDAASHRAKALASELGMTLIPPFDDPDVIAGQGTVARELLEQCPDLEVVYIAVGGGGLAAGMAVYLKELNPAIKVIGVEVDESACLKAALDAGQPVTLPSVGIFADGVAVKTIGTETFRLCQAYLDDVVTVTNDEICTAIKDIFDDTRVIAEPAGAMSVAAIRKYASDNHGKNVAGILCGANINFHTLRYVSERCELGEGKEAVLAVELKEETGAFKAFCETLGSILITEFNYRFASADKAHVFVGIKLKGGMAEYQAITTKLTGQGYQWMDLSNNELAKLHVRHMVGGKPPIAINERVFGFEFPEHPGALLQFLNTLGARWDITMFHYRNHGAADGLVLVGFNLPDDASQEFESHLAELGFAYQEHTADPAYRCFLAR